jgi:hypothetical protein
MEEVHGGHVHVLAIDCAILHGGNGLLRVPFAHVSLVADEQNALVGSKVDADNEKQADKRHASHY